MIVKLLRSTCGPRLRPSPQPVAPCSGLTRAPARSSRSPRWVRSRCGLVALCLAASTMARTVARIPGWVCGQRYRTALCRTAPPRLRPRARIPRAGGGAYDWRQNMRGCRWRSCFSRADLGASQVGPWLPRTSQARTPHRGRRHESQHRIQRNSPSTRSSGRTLRCLPAAPMFPPGSAQCRILWLYQP